MPTQDDDKILTLKTWYLKDLSFETTMGPAVWQMEWDPDIRSHFKFTANKLPRARWEALLSATVTTRLQDRVAYLVEVEQAGIYEAVDADVDTIQKALLYQAPRELYPILHDSLNSVIKKGGFPQVDFETINFLPTINEEVD